MPAQPGQPAAVLRIEMVITAAILGALVGTIVFAVLGFISANGQRFAIVGIVFLSITLAAPLNLAIGHAADGQTVATLLLMHVIAGGSIIGLLSRLGPRRAEFASDGAAGMPS